MNINLKLKGIPEAIIDQMIENGLAQNKTEAIRTALLFFGNSFFKNFKQGFVRDIITQNKREKRERVNSVQKLFR